MKPILYVDLDTGATHEEKVYGGSWLKLLYGTWLGRLFAPLVAAPLISRFYGWLQDRPASRKKISPFVERFDIPMDEFVPEEGRSQDDPYSTFNAFFTRRVSATARPFAPAPQFAAPCDARYFAYQQLDDSVSVPVKGAFLKASALIDCEEWQVSFEDGPGFVARLCPVDYHRFHFPDDGEVLASWRIPGALHSVNPWALAFRQGIFLANERQVSVLETVNFGKLLYIEVGATCVGTIRQTHTEKSFARGDEKGMFLFGGSTVIVIGEKDRWTLDSRLLGNTGQGLETYLKMGVALGSSQS